MVDAVSQLTMDLRPGEHLLLDEQRIVVELIDKSGKLARLRITAPRDVRIEKKQEPMTAMRGTMGS